MAVLVREHAHAGVLGLHDVVGQAQAGVADRLGVHDRAGVGPDGVDALVTAAAGLVLAGVHEHDVVDVAVGLEELAVAVTVELVLDVVVSRGGSPGSAR